jgi:hypothetical protein
MVLLETSVENGGELKRLHPSAQSALALTENVARWILDVAESLRL